MADSRGKQNTANKARDSTKKRETSSTSNDPIFEHCLRMT